MFYVNSKFLIHDSGSKFYEVVLITEDETGFGARSSDRSILIKRWGPSVQSAGKGQTLIQRGSSSELSAEFGKIIKEKKGYRSGKGKYLEEDRRFGIHKSVSESPEMTGHVLQSNFLHWQDEAVGEAILNYFNDESFGDPELMNPDEPEINRGETWASW